MAESGAEALGVEVDDRPQARTTLLDLNDDCIHEILSMKCLSVRDLCAAAETSRRLKEIAGRVFRIKNKTCDFLSLSNGETKTAKRIVKNFGSDVLHLKVSGHGLSVEFSKEVLAAVTEYCSALQSLELRFITIPEILTAKLNEIFKNLQKLTIVNCTFVDAPKELFAECVALVALKVYNYKCDDPALILEYTYPRLQRFGCNSAATTDSLDSFILRHLNLKSLSLGCDVESAVMQRIADCKQLESLALRIPENVTLDLTNHGHLRELDISCDRRNVSQAARGLNNLQFLEVLSLTFVEIDPECVRTLSQLKQLRVLKLAICTGHQNLNQMSDCSELTSLEIFSLERVDLDVALLVKRLTKLNYVTFSEHGLETNSEMYLRIVDVVRRRRDRSKLTIRIFNCYKENFNHLLPVFSRNAHLVEMLLETAVD